MFGLRKNGYLVGCSTVVLSCAIVLPNLVLPNLAYSHDAEARHEHKQMLNQLEYQSNRLRAIEQLLENREAQARAKELIQAEQGQQQGVVSKASDQTQQAMLSNEARALESWFEKLDQLQRSLAHSARRNMPRGSKATQSAQQPQDVKLNDNSTPTFDEQYWVNALNLQAPNTMAVLLAFERFGNLTDLLQQVLNLRVSGNEDVTVVVNWLALSPDPAQAGAVTRILIDKQLSTHLADQLHQPIRSGALNVARSYQQAAFELLMRSESVERSIRSRMLADLQRLMVYGEDRVFSHTLLSRYYAKYPDLQADWLQLVDRAWSQASLDSTQAKHYAPYAAHAGVVPALMYWANTARHDHGALSSLAQLVEVPAGEDVWAYVRNVQGSLNFDASQGRYILQR